MSSFDSVAWIVAAILVCVMVRACNKEDELRSKQCQEAHQGKPYTVETVKLTTKAGCTVTRVQAFDGECRTDGSYMYVTSCAGVCWDVTNGKSSHRECNTQ